jgi:hypothetical protein
VVSGFCLGFAVAATIALIDLLFGTPIFDLLKGVARSENAAYARLNRGVSALAILVWPFAAFAWRQGWHAAALLLPPALFALTLFSQSSASIFALGGGLLAAAVACLGRTAARLVLAAGIAGALLAAPLAVDLMQRAGLEQSDLIHQNGLHRLHIWGVVSERIAERPFFGWGFDASPDLPTAGVEPFAPDRKIIPSHPHNGALQIMVETGIVGSLLAVALLALIARRIDCLATPARACAAAMLITVLGIAWTAYGIWQSHWLALIGRRGSLRRCPAGTAGEDCRESLGHGFFALLQVERFLPQQTMALTDLNTLCTVASTTSSGAAGASQGARPLRCSPCRSNVAGHAKGWSREPPTAPPSQSVDCRFGFAKGPSA